MFPNEDGGEILEAALGRDEAGSVALKLFLGVNDKFYPEFIVRARQLSISLSDGSTLTLQKFMAMGEAYWEDFAERGKARRDKHGCAD